MCKSLPGATGSEGMEGQWRAAEAWHWRGQKTAGMKGQYSGYGGPRMLETPDFGMNTKNSSRYRRDELRVPELGR